MTPMRTHELVCEDLRLGRIGRRFLSLDVHLIRRHTSDWGGRVLWYPDEEHPCTYRGWFYELAMQQRVRWFAPDRPARYRRGLEFGEWDTPTWVGAPGVHRDDLRRLAHIGRVYQNIITTLPDGSPLNEVRFMPSTIVEEVHEIVSRLQRDGLDDHDRRRTTAAMPV